MSDTLDFNDGGDTRPGTRAVVHPGSGSCRHVVLFHVVSETADHFILDDGFTYEKRSGAQTGPAGMPTLQGRFALTEGSATFDRWLKHASVPNLVSSDGRPRVGSTAVRSPGRRVSAKHWILPGPGCR